MTYKKKHNYICWNYPKRGKSLVLSILSVNLKTCVKVSILIPSVDHIIIFVVDNSIVEDS